MLEPVNISPSKRILQGVLSGFGFTAVSIVVILIQYRLAVDFLTTELAGIWMLYLTFSAYVSFLDLGFSPTLSREIGFALGGNEDESVKRQNVANLIKTTLRVFQALAVIIFILGFVGGLFFLKSIVSPNLDTDITISWLIFMMGAAISVIGGAAFASLYGMGDVSTERILRSIFLLVGLILSYVVLKLGYGLIGLTVSWMLQNILARFVALIILYNRYNWLRSIKGVARKTLFDKMTGPSMRWAITTLGGIMILQSSNVIIAATLGPASIPPYEAVSRIVMALITLSLLIVTSSTPFISRYHAAGEEVMVKTILYRNVKISLSTICILCAFVAVFCDEIITVWLGSNIFPGWFIVWTLLLMAVLETHHVALASAVMATGKVVFAKVAILAGVLNIVLALLLVKIYGLWGIALGIMMAQLVTNNWYVPFVAFKNFKINSLEYAKAIIFPLLVFILTCILVNTLAHNLIYSDGLFGLVLNFITTTVVCMIVAWIILLKSPEKQYIRDIVGRKIRS